MSDTRRPFCCDRCGARLGECTATVLFLGDAVLTRKTTLHCARCGGERVWTPLLPRRERCSTVPSN